MLTFVILGASRPQLQRAISQASSLGKRSRQNSISDGESSVITNDKGSLNSGIESIGRKQSGENALGEQILITEEIKANFVKYKTVLKN